MRNLKRVEISIRKTRSSTKRVPRNRGHFEAVSARYPGTAMPNRPEAEDEELRYVPPPGVDDPQLLDQLLGQPATAPAKLVKPAGASEVVYPDHVEHDDVDDDIEDFEERRPRRRRRAEAAYEDDEVVDSGLSWGRQLFVEFGAFIIFGVGVYAIDMSATVFGLTSTVLPATGIGMILAGIGHVLISLGQRHYVRQGGWLRLAGVALLLLNTTLNVYGIIPVADRVLGPDFLGSSIPRSPGEWVRQLWATVWGSASAGDLWAMLWGNEPERPIAATGASGWLTGTTPSLVVAWPSWTMTAIVLVIICGIVAWYSEIILLRLYRRVRRVWRRR
jgi:hypothetical protein